MTTHTAVSEAAAADTALKARHAAMWALGDYPAVAREVIPDLGRVLVEACRITSGQDVLDVAAGSGNAAVPAARQGAHVTASDLAPELLDAGRGLAEAAGVTIRWERADAEALPYADASFDVVMSCVGVMFAPHHDRSSAELVRVARPGATIGLVSWTPEGFIGRMFAAMKPYAAPPPPGAQPPPLWGSEAHVRELFRDRVESLTAEKRTVAVPFSSGEEFRDFFKRTYGPTIATYRLIADDPGKVAALDAALADLGSESLADGGPMRWEYLLVTARRASS
ncbi:class I SAM-dependent methyltransferase [Terrabacter sp. 2RAF25]|uniref:class I SAM-dependent methyltransferase n=1 Tax=Terrabacter sp. 2RAF25 TaxID=3232998 RepID=UPI003F9CCE2C